LRKSADKAEIYKARKIFTGNSKQTNCAIQLQ